MPDVTISCDQSRLDLEWVISRIRASYWGHWQTRDQILRAIENSACFGLYEDGRQIGFCRVVTDFSTFSSITDMLIDDDLRHQGHGSHLMRFVVDHPSVKGTICVLASRDAIGFYRRFGFELMEFGVMKRMPA